MFKIKISEDVLISRLSGRRTCVECGAVYHDIFSPPKYLVDVMLKMLRLQKD